MSELITHEPGSKPGWRDVPATVWALGFVSLFMDTSSKLIHALLPLFLVDSLGVGVAAVGLIEGVAEATASVTKIFSGVLSDRIGKRKLLAAFGYSLSAASKPVFPLAASVGTVLAARFVDRVGKGIRGAPRDALIADVTPPDIRGTASRIAAGARQCGRLRRAVVRRPAHGSLRRPDPDRALVGGRARGSGRCPDPVRHT